MIYNNFSIRLILCCIWIGINSLLIAFAFLEDYFSIAFCCFLILLISISTLWRIVNESTVETQRFLDAIRYHDYSQKFNSNSTDKKSLLLSESYNKIITQFQSQRTETELQNRYLQTIIRHIGVGIITFDLNGTIDLFNLAAKKIFKRNQLSRLHQLEEFDKKFVELCFSQPNGSRIVHHAFIHDEQISMHLFVNDFKIQEKQFRLVAIQNILTELEERELDAWQNLIRVLTHEIMNSITPITSLSDTSVSLLKPHQESKELPMELFEDLNDSLQTIYKRSQGLLQFVSEYRNLTRIPIPKPSQIHLSELFNSVFILMKSSFESASIQCSISITPTNLVLFADAKLIEQVLINLINNAIDALKGATNPRIKLSGFIDEQSKVVIQVKDNGLGIPDEIKSQLFIPFFTSKVNGTGIGLSLSKMIMRKHGGNIIVQSKLGEGAKFSLKF